MTLSSCGCKVPWALRGGCGSCGSLGRSRRYTVSSTAAWVPSSPHILFCTAATHSQGAAYSLADHLPVCGPEDGDGGCVGTATVATLATVFCRAPFSPSLSSQPSRCLYLRGGILAFVRVTHRPACLARFS